MPLIHCRCGQGQDQEQDRREDPIVALRRARVVSTAIRRLAGKTVLAEHGDQDRVIPLMEAQHGREIQSRGARQACSQAA
jgi:predicted esterase